MNEVREALITPTTPNGSATLPFVIPSVAEGSAVHSAFATKGAWQKQICHPDRSVPGFPATQHWTGSRVRLSVKKGA